MVDSDVVVVGASLAGCAAARLFALRGARVTLVEKRPDPDAYKVVCTHYLQPAVVPILERLGLLEEVEQAGAVRAMVDIWTRWGWLEWQDPDFYGFNLRREVLDPMLRRAAVETPGVDYLGGGTVDGLVEEDGRIRGVHVRGPDGEATTVRARLVVGADGRDSRTARLAGVPARLRPHGRFGYFAYFEGVPRPRGERSQMWLLDPDCAYSFPGDGGRTCIAAFFAGHERVDGVRRDPDAAVRAVFDKLEDAPGLAEGRRVSKWIGKIDNTNLRRPPAARGIAFAGDAAMASDPVWGVGCGYAFQSADWLVEHTAGALHGSDADLDRALARYRRRHRWSLGSHHFLLSDASTGRRLNATERMLMKAAIHDRELALGFERFGARVVTPQGFLPGAIARAAAVTVRRSLAPA